MKGDSEMDIKDILPDEECDYIDTCWYKMTPKDLRRLETSMYCTWNDLYFNLSKDQTYLGDLFRQANSVYIAVLERAAFRRGVEYALEAMKKEVCNNNSDSEKLPEK